MVRGDRAWCVMIQRSLIAEAPPEEQAEVLRLIADIFVNNSREATDPVQFLT